MRWGDWLIHLYVDRISVSSSCAQEWDQASCKCSIVHDTSLVAIRHMHYTFDILGSQVWYAGMTPWSSVTWLYVDMHHSRALPSYVSHVSHSYVSQVWHIAWLLVGKASLNRCRASLPPFPLPLYTHTHTRKRATHTHTHTHTGTKRGTHTHRHTWTQSHIKTHANKNKQTQIHENTHTRTQKHTHIWIKNTCI